MQGGVHCVSAASPPAGLTLRRRSSPAVFDNTVTFRVSDATIDLPPIQMGYSGDIFFEFRTTKEKGTFLHVEGPDDYLKVSMVGEFPSPLATSSCNTDQPA